MTMRRSTLCLGILGGLALLCAGLLIHAFGEVAKSGGRRAENSSLVRRLALSDLCIFTEASYTRHLGSADSSTPFQETAMSMEHFPSGSLVPPPTRPLGNHP